MNLFSQLTKVAPLCQCTQYVANRLLLSRLPNTDNWNHGFLQFNRFKSVADLTEVIVVMQRSFPQANSRYNHAVPESIDKSGKINVRVANQYLGSNLVNESSYSNVGSTVIQQLSLLA